MIKVQELKQCVNTKKIGTDFVVKSFYRANITTFGATKGGAIEKKWENSPFCVKTNANK